MSSTLAKSPYDNILVKNSDGLELFTCDSRRANWYLSRNLAAKISEEPCVIALNFKPNGLGHHGDPYFMQEFKNVCVACGTTENLTRHHVFPQQFNKYVPRELGAFMRSNSYNVKLLCVDCHTRYEMVATSFKHEILEKSGYGIRRHMPEHFDKAKKAAWALLNFSNAIPSKDYPKLLGRVEKFLGKKYPNYDLKDEESVDDLFYIVSLEHHLEPMNKCYKAYFKDKIKTIDDINDFIVMWRKHFVKTMNPKYLPEHWDVERRFTTDGK